MDELKKLYDVLIREGKYTKSFEEFQTQWGDQSYKQKVFDVVSRDGLYTKDQDSFFQKYSGQATPAPAVEQPVTDELKKKGQSATTVSRSEDTSLVSPTQQTPKAQPKQTPQPEDEGVLSKIGNAALKAQSATMLAAKKTADVTTGLASSAWKWFLETSDNIVNAEKNMLKQGGFFDEDMPETDKPISDALKQQLEKAKTKGESPLDPRVIISSIATIANKVINSALPEKQRNEIINKLAVTSNNIQSDIKKVEAYQEKTLPKNIPTEIAKNIIGMAPELVLAGKMAGPVAAESKAAELTKKATEKATPFIRDNAPKAAKVLEESIVAPFTKIMATEYAVKSMADTKEGENVFWNGVEGAAEGTLQGMEMFGLGMAAGEVTKPVSKFISKAGINSAIATAIASPLSNAGVFTTARALRTAATEQRALTAEEIAMEAGTGAGFSLLHLKNQFDTHNEANHYYDNVLNDNKQYSFSRVLNETKANLDLAYNPDLTPEKVKELEEARDEIKKAILREPDLKKKQMLGNEAVKIQNQLDAHNNIQSIVEDKDFIVSRINDQDDLSDQQKKFFINKINAIADTYDMSEFSVKKRELNTRINETQKELDAAGELFTNLKIPSDRIKAKIEVDSKRKELDDLNSQLTELITNKTKEDAIQEQTTDESVLLSEQPELGLQEVGEGNKKPEVITGEEIITPEGTQEVTTTEAESPKEFENSAFLFGGFFTGVQRQGIGKSVIYDIFKSNPKLENILLYTQEDAIGFWKKLGGEVIKQGKDKNGIDRYFVKINRENVPESKKIKDLDVSYKNIDTKKSEIGKGEYAINIGKQKIGFFHVNDLGTIKVDPQDIIKGGETPVEVVAEVTPELTPEEQQTIDNIKSAPEYEKQMEPVDFIIEDNQNYKTYIDNALAKAKEIGRGVKKAQKAVDEYPEVFKKAQQDAISELEKTDAYKNANDIQRELLVREVRSKFGLKQKKAPTPEKLLGQKNSQEIKTTIKKYMTEISKAAKQGAKSVKDRISEATKKIEDYFQSVKEYGNLTRKDLNKIRKIMSNVGETEESFDKAVNKINDVIDNAKTDIIEMSEYKMLREMLLVAKEVKGNIEERRKLIKATIDNITKSGKVSAKQAGKLLNMLNKVNLDSDVQVEKVVEYAEKLFNDAEYAEKLDKANQLKASLLKLSKSKGKNVNLKMMAKAFSQIKPSMVEDIDAYNDMASKIKEAVAGSKIVGGDDLIKLAKMVNIDDVNAFIDESMQYQKEKMLQDKIAEAEEILGKDVSGMSYDDIVKLINEATEKNEPVDKDKKTIIKEAIKKLFADSSNTIKDIFSTGKNPITGEDLDISESKKDLVNRFMNMNLDLLEAKQSLNAVDALNNFIENGSTAGMENVVRDYQGKENAIEGKKLSESKGRDRLKAQPLKLYWSKGIGRFFAEQISTMPNLFERMFKGESKGAKFSKLSGVTELKNKKTYVQAKVNQIADDFTSEFYKRKSNGKDFNSQENIVERGMIADLKRNIIGTEAEQQAEFNRNKGIIEQSIDALKNGTEKEQEQGDLYQKVYDKILNGSKNIDDVLKKSDNNNIEAVDWWAEKWDDVYDDLADVSENVYNEVLDRDINYTPKRFSRLKEAGDAPELSSDESLFHRNNNGVYKKKTGVLEKATRPDMLPKNSKEEPLMYRDLSFDKNNINSMYDALMDINTAGVVRQVESFFKSKEIKSIIPSLEDRALLFNESGTGRVQEFVRALRGKQIVNYDEITKLTRALNTTAGIGVSAALGGVSQPLKQVVPVMFNTLINAGNVKMGYLFNDAQRKFLDKIGYGISIRGVESQANIESINKIMTLASRSTPKKALELIEKANKMWLKAFLEQPDVYIARASWLSYYEKALKKQGVDPNTIDYNTHEVNEDAADYAQRMVDRQQNISDKDLQGKFAASKDTFKQVISKVAMPFANFRLNQTMRMMSDISTLTSKTSSAEDKATARKSLGGFSVEMAVFKGIAYGMSLFLGSATKALMGQDETDEEYQERKDNSFKAQMTGTVSDVLSPLPMLDYPIVKGADFVGDLAQDFAWVEDEEKSHLYTNYKTDIPKSLGIFGIGLSKGLNLAEIINLSANGQFKDEYGRDKYISEDDKEVLKTIGVMSLISNFGLAPAEVNTIAKNAVKYAKKNSSTKTPEEIQGKALKLRGYDNAKEMKRYDPELYDKTFGKDSPLYESEKKFKEMKKQRREREIEAEDERRGYQPKRKSWFKKREKGSWFKKRKSE